MQYSVVVPVWRKGGGGHWEAAGRRPRPAEPALALPRAARASAALRLHWHLQVRGQLGTIGNAAGVPTADNVGHGRRKSRPQGAS